MSVTRDYGLRSAQRGPRLVRLALMIGVPIVLAAIGLDWYLQRQYAIAVAQAWTIAGPPCPSVSRDGYLAAPAGPASHAFQYNDVVFARAYGHVSCNEIKTDGGRGWATFPVCQFTSPEVLKVTTERGDSFFVVGSRPATVSVRDGQPACVMNADYRVKSDDAP
jgi:hypothetical protein